MSQLLPVGLLLFIFGALPAQNAATRVRNIVLVHGAWADGSGWRGVYDILAKDGYKSEAADGKRFPSDLSKSTAIKTTSDGYTYLDPAQFREYFAADLPAAQAAFAVRSQVLILAANFSGVITTPAWRGKPSWMAVATKDRTINPDLERWYAARAKSHMVEIAGASHSVYVTRPKEVAALIEAAATNPR